MLARPEFGSYEHIRLWLAGQRGRYDWNDPHKCAVGRYCKAHGMPNFFEHTSSFSADNFLYLARLNVRAGIADGSYKDLIELWTN